MRYAVLFVKPEHSRFKAELLPSESYEQVAVVEAENLEDLFQFCQNHDKNWHYKNIRSMSVGDLVVCLGQPYLEVYLCASIGFDLVKGDEKLCLVLTEPPLTMDTRHSYESISENELVERVLEAFHKCERSQLLGIAEQLLGSSFYPNKDYSYIKPNPDNGLEVIEEIPFRTT